MFEFDSEWDSDTFRTLCGLVKYNNGQFKTVKQALYLTKTMRQRRDGDTVEFARDNFGVDMAEGQYSVFIRATIRWADYGSDSYRPIGWIFVMDDQGVVSQNKLGWVGTMRQGTSVDPSKTVRIWSRVGEHANPLVFSAPAAAVAVSADKPVSQYFGQVGERVNFIGTIVGVREFQRQRFSYYDSGVSTMTRIMVKGNIIVYFGNHIADQGTQVEMIAKIKKHEEYNGMKQTVISHPKVINQDH